MFIALKHRETHILPKVLSAITIVYALSPIDLIPDFIPILGLLDDLIILPMLISLTIKLIPKNLFNQYRIEAEGLWKNGKPKKWYYATPFVLVWICVVLLIVKWIWF